MSQFIYPNFPLARPNIWHNERGGGIFKSEPEQQSDAYVISGKETWLDHASTTTFVKNSTAIITTAEDLAKYAKDVYTGNDPQCDISLWADIDLSAYEWYPIGTKSHPFTRSFVGYHTIKGMYINQPNMDYVGLIGYAQGGSIFDVTLEDGYVCGRSWVGSVVGYLDPGSSLGQVMDCESNLTVDGQTYVGGIGGNIPYGGGLVYTGALHGTGWGLHGGIAADTELLYNCTHDGPILSAGSDGVGGIAGRARGNISSCWHHGVIYDYSTYSSPNIGGVVGLIDANDVRCANNMATGSIFSMNLGSDAACLIGRIESGRSGLRIEECCANINSLAKGTVYGYISKKNNYTTAAKVTSCYVYLNNNKHFSNGSFGNWSIVKNINDGLPVSNYLFSVAVGGFTDAQIKAKFAELGLTLAEWC